MTQYNKAFAGGAAVAVSSIIIWILQEYGGADIPPAIQASLTTVIAGVVVWAVPNVQKAVDKVTGD